MKQILTYLLCFLIIAIALQPAHAQLPDKKITLPEGSITGLAIVKAIKNQTGLLFNYGEAINTKLLISVKSIKKQLTVKEAFQHLKGIGIDYEISGQYITLNTASGNSGTQKKKPGKISGKVVDEKEVPLSGASITIVENGNSTRTEPDGTFSLSLAPGSYALRISSISYETKTLNNITVEEDKINHLNIVLTESNSQLNEVVIVGYGEQSRKNIATSASHISADDYKEAVITTFDQVLQGRTSGVQVTSTSGEPGADVVVRIRGNNSLSGDNRPLYVIDGVPMPTYSEAPTNLSGSYPQNGLNFLNSNDIESVEILKDASATAIYGSRGANGVILITTKSGKGEKGKIEFDNKSTLGVIANLPKMMNSQQYAQVMNDYYVLNNTAIPFTDISSLPTTDWLSILSRNSVIEDVNLSLSGGTDKSSYYFSGGHLSNRGTIMASNYIRNSIRGNLSNTINKWYTVNTQFSYSAGKTNRAISASQNWPSSGGFMNVLRPAPTIDRDYTGYNSAGVPGFTGSWFANPFVELSDKTDLLKSNNTLVSFNNNFLLSKGLKFLVNVGGGQNISARQLFLPASTTSGMARNGVGNNSNSSTYNYNVNAYFSYDKTFNDAHTINSTLGAEYNKQIIENLVTYSSGYDIPYFGINNIGSAASQTIDSYKEERIIESAFFRTNYSYLNKYILNASIRLDGASPFSINKKIALFPSLALAWNIEQEQFMKDISLITAFKIRASYGETGSQAIGSYASLSKYDTGFYPVGPTGTLLTTLSPTSLGNNSLSWERTRQLNIGADMSMLENRLHLTFDFYNKTTSDLLQNRALPTQSGFSSIVDNYGNMRNRGIELSIQADIVKQKEISFSTGFNISRNKNILLDLGGKTTPDYQSIGGNLFAGVAGILVPGQAIGQFYGYKAIGLVQKSDFNSDNSPTYPFFGPAADQTPGIWKMEDLNSDGVINESDRQVLGKSQPDFVFGLTNNISWKGLSLNILTTGSVGNDVVNLTRFYLSSGLPINSGITFNQTQDWFNHQWTASNPTNDIRYPGVAKVFRVKDINSSMIEDGSYLRIKSLTLSYAIPLKRRFMTNPKVYFTTTNVYTWTHYKGFDPEVNSFGQSLLMQGIDYGAYPSQRSFTLGISTNF